MEIDDVNSHFGGSNGPPPSIMQSKICGGGRRVVPSSMATNEASIELKMLAFATAVKMDGACPNHASGRRSPCIRRRPRVLVIRWRRVED